MEIKRCQNTLSFKANLGSVNVIRIGTLTGEEGLEAVQRLIPKLKDAKYGDETVTYHFTAVTQQYLPFDRKKVVEKMEKAASESGEETEKETNKTLKLLRGISIDKPKLMSLAKLAKEQIKKNLFLPKEIHNPPKELNKIRIICEKKLIPAVDKPKNFFEKMKNDLFLKLTTTLAINGRRVGVEELKLSPKEIDAIMEKETLKALDDCNNDIKVKAFNLSETARQIRKEQLNGLKTFEKE